MLHDDDLADAIVERILERGRLLRLDGPSVRTKHLPDDELRIDVHDNVGGGSVSGIEAAEFPERTDLVYDYAGAVADGPGQCGAMHAPVT